MPYTLVTPHYPPVCRPILLLPTVLGRMLDKKLAGWQGFQLCEPGKKRAALLCAKKSPAHAQEVSFLQEIQTHLRILISLFTLTGHIFIGDCLSISSSGSDFLL